jgi:hypothetical protein
MIDLHGTIIKPNYKVGDIPTEFYANAKEALRIMSNANDICLIMYTCSHPHEIKQYEALFEENNIHFDYINENPEVVTQPDGYGCYDKKPYMNLLFDDKAGFIPEIEWAGVLDVLKMKYNASW